MASARRKPRPRTHPPAVYNVDEAQLRQQLVSGRERADLQGYLGPEQYRELQALALQAERQRARGGLRVYVLPGIMGSKIGRERSGVLPDDLLWVDPIEVCAGRLTELALPRGNRFRALGVMLLAYLKLKLRLEIAGFDADVPPLRLAAEHRRAGTRIVRARASRPCGARFAGRPQHGRAGEPSRHHARPRSQDRPADHARHAELRFLRAGAGVARHVSGRAQDRRARLARHARRAGAPRVHDLPGIAPDVAGAGALRQRRSVRHVDVAE